MLPILYALLAIPPQAPPVVLPPQAPPALEWQTLYFCTQDGCAPCLKLEATLKGYPLVGMKLVPLTRESGMLDFLKVKRTPTLILTDTSGKPIRQIEGDLTATQLADFLAGRQITQPAPIVRSLPFPRRRR